MSRRKRQMWGSQEACVRAWLRGVQGQTQEDRECEGWAKGWWWYRTMHFRGWSMWSVERWGEMEIARAVRTNKGRVVVLVRTRERERGNEGYVYRQRAVVCGAEVVGMRCAHVEQFDEVAKTREWYAGVVQRAVGRWQRARKEWSKGWRWYQVEEWGRKQRAVERAFGLRPRREASEVRVARVTQRLMRRAG